MSIRKQLIKDALILTPAIYMLAIWIYFHFCGRVWPL